MYSISEISCVLTRVIHRYWFSFERGVDPGVQDPFPRTADCEMLSLKVQLELDGTLLCDAH